MQLRCKEIWIEGANRYRNLDEDLPQDFEALKIPRDVKPFMENIKLLMKGKLQMLHQGLESQSNKKIVITIESNKGWIQVTPLVRWLLLLSANEDTQLTHTLEEIAMNRDPILKDAMQKWERMSQDPGFRMLYEARQKTLIDEATKLNMQRKKGNETENYRLIKIL